MRGKKSKEMRGYREGEGEEDEMRGEEKRERWNGEGEGKMGRGERGKGEGRGKSSHQSIYDMATLDSAHGQYSSGCPEVYLL